MTYALVAHRAFLGILLAALMVACSSNATGPSAPCLLAPVRVGAPLYVANSLGNSITTYAATASGNAPPIATIAGSNTALSSPWGIARDSAGRLYVANLGTSAASAPVITVFAPGASGNATPMATISGSNTGLHGVQGMAVSPAGRLYVANIGTSDSSDAITIYAPGASGNVAPTATIAGTNTGLDVPWGIVLDAGGFLYVANTGRPTGHITVYGPNDTGNVAPVVTIAGGNTELSAPSGIALDGGGQLYVENVTIVSNVPHSTITVYRSGASGNVAPSRTIVGGNSVGMAVDGECRLNVALPNGQIVMYAPDAAGNANPIVTIAGGSTGLSVPAFITF